MNQEPNPPQGQVPSEHPCATPQPPAPVSTPQPATCPPVPQPAPEPQPAPCPPVPQPAPEPQPAPCPPVPQPTPEPQPTPCPPTPTPCPPTPAPAPQPPAPPTSRCAPLPAPPCTPKLPDPPSSEPRCCCPAKPTSGVSCFDGLISSQAKLLAEADRAKTFKSDLEDIRKKALTAQQQYTVDKREAQLKLWTRTDTDIVALISTLACSLTCWECLIECRLCPLICDIRNLENRLHGTGGLTHEVYSLYDLNNWQLRNQTIRKDVFERIRDVLRAWETPAQTIDKALADNSKLYGEIQLSIAKEPAGALVDLVTRLVPKHIAIGPRDASGKVSTGIDVRFIDLCGCDTCVPDNCCGPDVGRVPVLMEITGPQPYLIEPDKLFDVMCCLVTERYEPAKQALAQADSAVAASKAEIDKAIADIASKKNSLTADFLFGLENPVDCRNYHPKTPACNGAPAPADPPCNCTKHDSDNPAPPR